MEASRTRLAKRKVLGHLRKIPVVIFLAPHENSRDLSPLVVSDTLPSDV